MVRKLIVITLIAIWASAATAERLLTVDELRLMAGEADRVQRQKAERIKGGDLSRLLPEKESQAMIEMNNNPSNGQTHNSLAVNQDETAKTRPIVTKYSNNTSMAAPEIVQKLTTAQPNQIAPVKTAKINLFEYVAPPRSQATDNSVYTDAVTVDELEYGIRIGSWVEAEMLKNTSSAEPGQVVFRVSEPVQGRYQELEAGTELFAEKAFNGATQRLEFIVSHGVTRAGKEFEVLGQVFDVQKTSGLDGIVKKKEMVKGSVQTGMLAATRSALGVIAKDSPIGAGTAATADVLLNEGEGAVAAQLQDQYVIYVSSQDAKIFITRAF